MHPLTTLFVIGVSLVGCAGVGQEADFPDMPDAVPSGPGALSGTHGEFVLYSTTGSESGKRKAASIGDAQSKYGAVVRQRPEEGEPVAAQEQGPSPQE